jgi:hypothetical protein
VVGAAVQAAAGDWAGNQPADRAALSSREHIVGISKTVHVLATSDCLDSQA